MGTTTNYGLRYPAGTDTPDVVRDITNLANDVDTAIHNQHAKLPTPVYSGQLGSNTTSTTTFAALSGVSTVSFTTSADVWCAITFGAYLKIGGSNTCDLTGKVVLSGATTGDTDTDHLSNGTLYLWANGTSLLYETQSRTVNYKLLAGTTTFTFYGVHSANATTMNFNNCTLEIQPIKWATEYQ